MKNPLLIVDDDPDVISALRYLLQTEGYEVATASSPDEALQAIRQKKYAAILIDLNYSKDTTSGREGLALITRIIELDSSLPIIAMTAWGRIDTAVKAMQLGARDFLQKPWENERLLSVLVNQLRLVESEQQTQRLSAENRILRSEVQSDGDDVFFRSAVMRDTLANLEQVARSNASLLMTGENGTGKSFLVNRIHKLSDRRDGPLIKVNMGAITETLFESEMFGHVKGAFTDARENRMGRFELADGGTLFLDEIGNTPLTQQSKLLRVLEDLHFEKVGSMQTRKSDCRIISATNCHLDTAVAEGRFRQDLLYRLNTVTIHIPSLRERAEDILPLAEYFLHKHRLKYNKPYLQFDDGTREALLDYCWPGNIRELSHVVERSTILATDIIDLKALGMANSRADRNPGNDVALQNLTLDQVEKWVIESRLNQHQGNSQLAADTLGLSKSAFYRHLKKHGLK